ncbi:hypothetical protein CALVIDRAFT_336336 [Calocera viscosa TUFC12733]|uniref:VOC domain-containing protein n=1 Tax=Calocera viscosa (strain TUFC12733) TaxID=1330018 RepID=A0A167HNM9_CALVF|nr:hypothetical protein CALVIDRAFT_336336 [Calocera viscosa TUFC12733]
MAYHAFSVILNISIPVRDFPKAITFYATIFEVLGAENGALVKSQHDEEAALSFRWGNQNGPSFTVVKKRWTTRAGGISVTLRAPSEKAVDNFYRTAMAGGATSDVVPALVQMSGLAGYMCAVFDFDGNELKALYAEPYTEAKDLEAKSA